MSQASNITVDDRLVSVAFDRFGLEDYDLFLKTKRLPESRVEFDAERESYVVTAPARFAHLLGAEDPRTGRAESPLADYLWDYQRFIAKTALDAKRYAIWADCGLGKTAMFLEFARQAAKRTGKRGLILSPLQIIPQTIEQAWDFYGPSAPVMQLEDREELIEFCAGGPCREALDRWRYSVAERPGAESCDLSAFPLAICNYEKMIPGVVEEMRMLGQIVLDESSILKTGGGVIKWNVIKSAKGIEYKASCTATPAPNDTMEYASQASFLETIRNEGEVLWTWFTRDKSGEWRIKPHAREGFYRFMAGWSIYLRNPAAYGFQDNIAPVPDPVLLEHRIPPTEEQSRFAHDFAAEETGDFFASERMGISTRSKLSQAAKGFIYQKPLAPARIASLKPGFLADLIRSELASGLQVLVWTVFDEEGEILLERLGGLAGVEMLCGKTPEKHRQPMIERFRRGETRCLIGKASMLGYGINFQHVGSMIFSGWNDSFEQWYQAIRRAYRYGQLRSLRVHVPVIEELEGKMLQNVFGKRDRFEADTRIQEENYIRAMKGLLAAVPPRSDRDRGVPDAVGFDLRTKRPRLGRQSLGLADRISEDRAMTPGPIGYRWTPAQRETLATISLSSLETN